MPIPRFKINDTVSKQLRHCLIGVVAMYLPSMYNQELYDMFGATEFLNARPSRDLDIAEEKRGFGT